MKFLKKMTIVLTCMYATATRADLPGALTDLRTALEVLSTQLKGAQPTTSTGTEGTKTQPLVVNKSRGDYTHELSTSKDPDERKKFLLEKAQEPGVPYFTYGRRNEPFLTFAIREGLDDVVNDFLGNPKKYHIDEELPESLFSDSPLYVALEKNKGTDLIKKILNLPHSTGPNNVYLNAFDEGSRTLLDMCLKNLNTYRDIAQLLIDKGSDINLQEPKTRKTYLMKALDPVNEKSKDKVDFILQKKNIKRVLEDSNGKTAYDYAVEYQKKNPGKYSIDAIVQELSEGVRVLKFTDMTENNLEKFAADTSKNKQKDMRDDTGDTILIAAVKSGYKELVTKLLSNKNTYKIGNVDEKDAKGDTALYIAVDNLDHQGKSSIWYDTIATALLKNGANIHVLDSTTDDTYLIKLIKRFVDIPTGYVDQAVKFLIQHGVNKKAHNKEGKTAYDYLKEADTKNENISDYESFDEFKKKVIDPIRP